MCGIFAYLNFNVNRERSYILEVLFNGLRRLEYRGYDSSGICFDIHYSFRHHYCNNNNNNDNNGGISYSCLTPINSLGFSQARQCR